jgi:RNA polymerase sigma factor (sigma-70 family)
MRTSLEDDGYQFVSDDQWRQDILRDDPGAIQYLINFCRTITHNYLGRQAMPDYEQAALDVAEMIRAKLKTESVQSLRSWIRQICRNTCYSLLRKEYKLAPKSADDGRPRQGVTFESLADQHDLVYNTATHPVEQDLPEIDEPHLRPEDLEGLTDREKRIVALFLEGHRPPEIAAIMDITVNNVRASWNQLLKKLRKLRQR